MKHTIYIGNTLEVVKTLPDESVDCIVTSPPYWGLRDYGVEGQIGLEPTLEEYLEKLLKITAELKRVLKKTGVMFWNHGDNYSTSPSGNKKENWEKTKIPQKCMCLQNYRLVLRMIDEQSWILRNVIIWHKPNHMPSSVKDRFTNAYEPVFFFSKNKKYWFDLDAVRVEWKDKRKQDIKRAIQKHSGYSGKRSKFPAQGIKGQPVGNPLLGKNPGDIWTIPTHPFPEAHFATYPEKLVEPMIKAGCPKNGITLDPFAGSGTTMIVAEKLGRNSIGIELNPEYVEIIKKRFKPYLAQAKLNGNTELKIIHTGDVNGRNCGKKI